MFAGDYICSQSFSQERQFTFGRAAVDKLEQSQAFVIRDGDHRVRAAYRFAPLEAVRSPSHSSGVRQKSS